MHFRSNEEFSMELDKVPKDENIIHEDGIYWLNQDYAINRMNEIFGEGNWSIEKIRKQEFKNEMGQSLSYSCVLTVSYKNPVNGLVLTMDGISATDGTLDNNIIGRAFLNAISHLGNTFGSKLSYQFE